MNKKDSWIEKYINFMRNDDVESAIFLKESHIPKSLYKYRTLDDFTLDNIESNTVWISDINTLNDPFEGGLFFDQSEIFRHFFSTNHFINGFKSKFGVDIPELELEKILKSEDPFFSYSKYCESNKIKVDIDKEKQFTEIEKLYREINKYTKNQVRIFSLSERNDSILMWSHYAMKHEGICIEYECNDFDKYRAFLQPIYYSDKLYKIQKTNDISPQNALMASLYKSKDWQYEKEWRLTILSNLNTNNNLLEAPIPKAIYLGMRYDYNNPYKKKQLIRICKEKNIKVFQMKIHPNDYKIIIDYEVQLK